MTDNRKYRNIRNIDKRINNLQEQYKNQFSFINDLGKKIETLDSSLDNLKSNIKENYDSLKTLKNPAKHPIFKVLQLEVYGVNKVA